MSMAGKPHEGSRAIRKLATSPLSLSPRTRSPVNAKRRSRRGATSSTPSRSNSIGWSQPFAAFSPTSSDRHALNMRDFNGTASQSKDVEVAARALGLEVRILHANTEREIETVFESLSQVQAGGLVIGANAFFFSRRDQLVGLAARHSVPTVYPWREAVVAGGLMSYGANVAEADRLAGHSAGRILEGDNPAALPFHQ